MLTPALPYLPQHYIQYIVGAADCRPLFAPFVREGGRDRAKAKHPSSLRKIAVMPPSLKKRVRLQQDLFFHKKHKTTVGRTLFFKEGGTKPNKFGFVPGVLVFW
ncbi:MAG: hypothetical protein FWH02_03645 [Oscillospiraceae bacterium]|nr:hypothetical protein [Oscillospiraceae bacterium]